MKCQQKDCNLDAKYVLELKAKYLEIMVNLCEMHYLSCFDHTTKKQADKILKYAVLSPEILD